MSKKTIYICDICGEENSLGGSTLAKIEIADPDDYIQTYEDVCSDCWSILHAAIENRKAEIQ